MTPASDGTPDKACGRANHSLRERFAAELSVEAVEKPVYNFGTINFGDESHLKLFSQRFMALIFTYEHIFLIIFHTITSAFVFLQLRYATDLLERYV